ncbi:MAG: hypothetical protein V4723_09055 [Pseudomonadota bacterium]
MNMPKNKRPVPRKSSTPPQEDDEVMAQALADLALDIAEQEGNEEEGPADPAALALKQEEFAKLVRNALRKKNDEVLYGAIELARYADVGAYQYLRTQVEEAAATVILRREGTPAMEINAFAVPIFVHSIGGLKQEQTFQDEAAFSALVDSFTAAGLESPKAKVVLVSHAYDGAEADNITYSQLNDMLRDAAASMTDRKLVPTPALERSIAGWEDSSFGTADQAVELRYLLGFALKRADDPFYLAPSEPAAADAWYEARMARYRAWTEAAAPLLKRCLASQSAGLDIHFQYQDLFFGARAQGVAELGMLAVMSDMNAAIETHGGPVDNLQATVGPAVEDDDMVLQVTLADAAGVQLTASRKPLDVAADLQAEVDDLCDALSTLGITSIAVAQRFDPSGAALEVQAWPGLAG